MAQNHTLNTNTMNIGSGMWVATAAAFGKLNDLFVTAMSHYAARRTATQLSALSDSELDDIGLSRGDIIDISHGTYKSTR